MFMLRPTALALILALAATACGDSNVIDPNDSGARTDHPVIGDGSGEDRSTPTDGPVVPTGDGGDVVVPDAGPLRPCADDVDCDDQEGCTIDRCGARGFCEYTRDTSCNSVRTGGSGRPFSDEGQQGVAYDPASMGLIVRAESRRADYLWIPNTNESTLSKWDATTGTEIARYRVGLPGGECVNRCCWESGCNMPSRTVVDGVGDAYIANRGFAMQGTVTKIAADRRDCVDRNGNGMIDTSTGPGDVRPYGQDECVLWTANVGPVNAVLRSLAIDQGDENFPQGYPWAGSCANAGFDAVNNAGLFQLNPRTGEIIRSVPFGKCAYGAVVTPDGTLWEHSYFGHITPVNTRSGMVGASIAVPERGGMRASYGITTDARGRLWLSGRGNRDVLGYDPATRQWTRVDLSAHVPAGGASGLGITVDTMNRVWVPLSMNADWTGPTRVAYFNADEFMGGGMVPSSRVTALAPPMSHQQPTAVGADRAGNIWVASAAPGGTLLRYEPTMDRWTSFTGPNRVYTYTDFTGAVRRLVIGSGTYSEDYETCEGGTYGELYWSGETPPGTQLVFSMQIANTRTGLAMAPPIALGATPPARSPINIAQRLRDAGVMNMGRFVRVTVTLVPATMPMVATPILRSLSFTWRCGGVG